MPINPLLIKIGVIIASFIGAFFMGWAGRTSSPIDLPAIADLHDEDANFLILDAGDDAVVAYTVLPEFAEA